MARHFRSPISSRSVILALRSVRQKIGTPLLIVWGRLNAHRSRATAAFISAPKTMQWLTGRPMHPS